MSSPPASTSQPQPVNGRFSGVHKWPVLSVARGLPATQRFFPLLEVFKDERTLGCGECQLVTVSGSAWTDCPCHVFVAAMQVVSHAPVIGEVQRDLNIGESSVSNGLQGRPVTAD